MRRDHFLIYGIYIEGTCLTGRARSRPIDASHAKNLSLSYPQQPASAEKALQALQPALRNSASQLGGSINFLLTVGGVG